MLARAAVQSPMSELLREQRVKTTQGITRSQVQLKYHCAQPIMISANLRYGGSCGACPVWPANVCCQIHMCTCVFVAPMLYPGPLDCGFEKDVYSVPLVIQLHAETLPLEIGRGEDLPFGSCQLYTVNGILQTKFAVVSRCVSGIQICAPKPDLVRHCVPRPAVGAAAWRVDTDATPKLI